MEQLHRDLQSLTAKFQAMQTPSKKSRRRRNKAAVTPAPSTVGASQPAFVSVSGPSGTRRRKRRARGRVDAGVGTMTLQRREYLRDVTVGVKGALVLDYIDIIPANFEFLQQFKMFDRVKWNKLHIFYKPGVGSITNGFVNYGVLWGFDKTLPTKRSGISALTPNAGHAVWADGEPRPIVCPVSKLQTRPWFTPDDSDSVEKGPGRIVIGAESSGNSGTTVQVVGELWVDYSVTLTGSSF